MTTLLLLLRRRWPLLVALLAALVAVVAVALVWDRPADARTVAIVDRDDGWELDGETLRAGEALVASLAEDETSGWTVVPAGDDASATVTVPADFSESVASLWGPEPRQARLDLQLHTDDAGAAGELSSLLSSRIGADGIGDLLTDTATARTRFQQAGATAGLLTAGTKAAADAAGDLTGSADELLPLLETARSGATELLDVSRTVSGAVGQASGPAEDAAARLDTLGLTLGDVTEGADRAALTLDRLLPVVEPLAPEAAESLGQASADLTAVSTQLAALPGMLGGSVDQTSELGELVRVALGQVSDASAQLSSAAQQLDAGIGPLAEQAPTMLAEVTGQITAGFDQLNALSGQVSSGIGQGMEGLPVRSPAQQEQLSTVLAAPVELAATSPEPLLTPQRTTAVLAGTTIVLAAVVGWMGLQLRRRDGSGDSTTPANPAVS
ncbi:hypothetical protein G4H71_09360 [Rhodococcus triatomae]|uniref:Putative membrane protein n=1 Tax=Rhodococcus triatomae TaxID=300028 RepID=A0A1G8HU40_9NOCA|nr:hypothetical protein [Rhodococcus triatomae]QNG20875.1 hypothetical protein G4H72_21025 [Rhodococcus triatomae]QNG23210.1 hypothetical protein G4H71_09360 [Rhodococcus triatomae]SDI10000.1 putative membrane protein [Rhodococcus triatomae]